MMLEARAKKKLKDLILNINTTISDLAQAPRVRQVASWCQAGIRKDTLRKVYSESILKPFP